MIDKRVVMITGAAGNLGLATVKKYTDKGDAVVMVDVSEEKGRAKEKEFRSEGREVTFFAVDITDEAACRKLVNDVADLYGRIDVLCNNAATICHADSFFAITNEEFMRVLNINLVSQFTLCKLVARKMIDLGTVNGVIINTGSTSGFMGNEDAIVYAVSKAAVHSLTANVARELAPYGIRCCALAPTAMNGIMKGSTMNPADIPEYRELNMSNRVLETCEVANVSYFLSTPEASAIRGSVVKVDDGYTEFKQRTFLTVDKG